MKAIKIIFTLIMALWLLPMTMVTAGPLDGASGAPLHPDKAFTLSTRSIDGNTLEASWKIADDYYMYRKFFKFVVLDKNIELGTPVIPQGIIKLDKTFNEKLEIFKHDVAIQLPFKRLNAAATQTKIRITSQGCNEPIGLCYTPITKDITFKLLPAAAAATGVKTDTPKSLKDLQKNVSSGSKKPDYLPADQAFKVEVKPSGKNRVRVSFDFEKKYYLYKKEIQFRLVADNAPDADIRLGQYSLPRGKKKTDKYVGETEVYTRKFSVTLPILGQKGQTYTRKLTVRYQGCKEDSICYPPNTKVFNLSADTKGKLQITDISPSKTDAATTTSRETASRVDTWTFIKTVLIAFGIGLFLTFTPCVLPMIPILSSIIIGQSEDGEDKSNLHGGALSISYVLGTSVIWTIAGVIAGATGQQFHAYFQNVWFLGGASVLFVLLAFSMFGFYNLQMPGFIQSHFNKKAHGMKGGTLFGVFLLGIFSSMVVGACVSAPLIFALGTAIKTADPVLGGVTMFSLSLGMGVILILIGFGANWLLPRAGAWMDTVKHFFGVLLIAVAIYLLGQIPEPYTVPTLYLWAPLLIIYSIYLGAFQSLPEKSSGWRYFSKGLGMLLFVWGVLALIGAFSGNRDVFRPIDLGKLSGGSGAVQVKSMAELFIKVKDVKELNQRIEEARQAGKPVLVDYYASWCTDCIRMERGTFRDPAVQDVMSRFVSIKIDVSKPGAVTDALKSRLNVYGPPATILFDSTGKERKDLNFYGYRSAKDFIAILEKV